MGYETGTASSYTDLMTKLETFILTKGWTVDNSGSGLLSVHQGSVYLHYKALADSGTYTDGPGVLLKASTAYGGAAWTGHTDEIIPVEIEEVTGTMTYYFFVAADFIHIVIKNSNSRYKYLLGGVVEKAGAFNGGVICCGSHHYDSGYSIESDNNYYPFRADSGSRNTSEGDDNRDRVLIEISSTYYGKDVTGPIMYANGVRPGSLDRLFDNSPNSFNQITPLFKIPLFIFSVGDFWTPIGPPQDIRFCNMQNHSDGDEITIGSDTWIIFPFLSKITAPATGNFAYAFKKVV